MPPKISKLTLAGFRGATIPTTISFEASKPVVLIFGENGTGKSTIADAFDFICNRSFGSLENFSLGEPAKKHVASLGVKPVDISVILESGGKTWQATMGKNGPVVSPLADLPDARVLRRRTILSLIEAQPKQRFEALKAFIAVPNIEKCEATLRDAVNSMNNAATDLSRAIEQARDDLSKFWIAEGQPGVDAMVWATSESAKDISKLQEIVDSIDAVMRIYHKVETALLALDAAVGEQSTADEALSVAERRRKLARVSPTATKRRSAQTAAGGKKLFHTRP